MVNSISGSPPGVVHTPTGRVTVSSGDTLTTIGAQTSRTWEQLAGFNHLPNPNLILAGQVLTIPPEDYVPPALVALAATTATSLQLPQTPTSQAWSPAAHASAPAAGITGIWACIGEHESGNNPATNTGNGYYGAFQDTLSAWRAGGGGPGLPSDYSYAEQLAVNERIQAIQGWGAWPNTSRMCGM
jgi:LysM repeat protein